MSSILIIDDEHLVRQFLRMVLEARGHEVREAADGLEGLRQYEAEPADLVICDLCMEERDGVATMLELRRVNPEVRMIAMTGQPLVVPLEVLCDAQICGAVATLQKPFTPIQVLDVVERSLALQPV